MDYLLENFGLSGKVAMVTGGNSGIGWAIAQGLAKAGADLFLYTHSARNIEEVTKEIEAIGRKVKFAHGDLDREDDAMAAVEKCIEAYGKIDILVNNAGMIHRAPLLEGDNEGWKKVIDLNLSAVYYLSKVAGRHMTQQGSGKIINIASMLSFQGGKFVPSYTASKHGVAGLTKAFANELAESNVQINAIAPGYIETANTAPIRADEKRNAEILGRIPAGRWGKTEDLAAAAVFLASKASDYMNGHVLCVDGGWLVR
ncbi:2-dehydro-3-deoxy-D-gluconate 5-dehydrogenase [Clostridium formicaceticum]|uniref:2-dehydro-3-deoxy-D-gluconate 5-dehydrogenase n=2 Tax=Clostridium formicaceticum TaxID=1497 RepID=A0AAC9RJ43_9CLOT|nr:2-dehydro-3-deoxy-D-gluconate 5-dehydrogenase KduD [Clostridium formicaceticum]AOY76085.1 2-deoxy-D-gluconate 3-dehydrogenase [Clostridium formicaceticum]ARE86447.1 2-dehydro-3-deoxy-D-gluconate 5-dehydrogenase [Clostridium formicaceticum]